MKNLLLCVTLLWLIGCAKDEDAGSPPEKTVNDVVLTAKPFNVPVTGFDIGPYSFHSVMVGNAIYFASNSNTAKPQFFTRYDINSNAFSAALAKSPNVCGCGYSSRLVTDGTNVFYIANDATRYVASSNTWQTLSFPTTAKDNHGEAGAAYFNGNIYFVGGRTASTLFKYYSIGQDKWFTVPNYLYPANSSEMAVYKDRLYAIGGQGIQQKVSYFSTTANSWTALKDVPFPVNTSSTGTYSAVLNEYLFLLQGKQIYVYDLTKDTWSAAIPLPDAPNNANLFTNGQKLFLAGKNAANIPVVTELTMSFK